MEPVSEPKSSITDQLHQQLIDSLEAREHWTPELLAKVQPFWDMVLRVYELRVELCKQRHENTRLGQELEIISRAYLAASSVCLYSVEPSDGDWAVTNLAANITLVGTPDSNNGKYAYEYNLTWTAPPAGFQQMELYSNLDSAPMGKTRDGWTYLDECQIPYVPEGTPLDWHGRIVTDAPLPSGTQVYWKMWTYSAEKGKRGDYPSNVCAGIIP